jgi:hypothetical protein
MTFRIALVLFFLSTGMAWAEAGPLPDDVSKAYDAALADLRAGKDRQDIARRLKPVIEKNGASEWTRLARPLLLDLLASAENAATSLEDRPERRLAETRTSFSFVYAKPWNGPLNNRFAKQAADPVAQVVAADRSIIPRLIPGLSDRTPTRCEDTRMVDWDSPQPRVCDLALALIEYHGKARFRQRIFFHQGTDAERKKIADRVVAWWQEIKDKPVASGVRAQLEHESEFYAKVEMAETLARLADGQRTDDRTFAMKVLKELVKQYPRNHLGVTAAEALARLGDKSPVKLFYNELMGSEGQPRTLDLHIVWYLCRHGGRGEWELMHTISLSQVRAGKQPSEEGVIWAGPVDHQLASTNRYAIPFLGLALEASLRNGRRRDANDSQPNSIADVACDLLQKQTGKDFGYSPTGSDAERLAAIKKAHAWWKTSGKAKYTFDYIEKRLVPVAAPPSRPQD